MANLSQSFYRFFCVFQISRQESWKKQKKRNEEENGWIGFRYMVLDSLILEDVFMFQNIKFLLFHKIIWISSVDV